MSECNSQDKYNLIDELRRKVKGPTSLDDISRELGAHSNLFNVQLSYSVNLCHLGFGLGIMIPAMISKAPGGRKSILDLDPGERTLTGVFVNGQTMALRYWTRETGNGAVAQGDIYREEWTSKSGRVLSTGVGKVESVDYSVGEAEISMQINVNIPPTRCHCSAHVILWSLICWAHCTCEPAKTSKN